MVVLIEPKSKIRMCSINVGSQQEQACPASLLKKVPQECKELKELPGLSARENGGSVEYFCPLTKQRIYMDPVRN